MRTTYARRREQRRLGQLGVCVILFTGVLIGRCFFPSDTLWSLSEKDSERSSSVSAFSELGSSAFQDEPVWEAFEHLLSELFGGSGETAETTAPVPGGDTLSYQAEREALHSTTYSSTWADHLGISISSDDAEALTENDQDTEPEQAAESTGETADAQEQEEVVQAVAQAYTISGEALPASVSLQYYSLGLSNTITPVSGTLSSEFGYRVHPVDGDYSFHYGLDIAADIGTDIVAYADGIVEYIGEDDTEYGLYVQIDHGNNVKTFYAHCSKLCVSQGQTVTEGEKIAEVGATGKVTGPHLHFEVKKDGIRLNPIYYVDLS